MIESLGGMVARRPAEPVIRRMVDGILAISTAGVCARRGFATEVERGWRLERDYRLAIVVGFGVIVLSLLWILCTRWGIGLPSLIDDHYYARQPGKGLGALVDL